MDARAKDCYMHAVRLSCADSPSISSLRRTGSVAWSPRNWTYRKERRRAGSTSCLLGQSRAGQQRHLCGVASHECWLHERGVESTKDCGEHGGIFLELRERS